MNSLEEYLELIVEPTFADMQRHPRSGRHAFLASVATFHSIDRAAHPRKPGNLRNEWREQSPEFLIVDMVAHRFKHVQSDHEKQRPPLDAIPLIDAVFGHDRRGPEALGLDLHNLTFVIRDAIRFIRGKIAHQT